MKTTFNLTKEDYWNFNKYDLFNNPKIRRYLLVLIIIMVVVNIIKDLPITLEIGFVVIEIILGYFIFIYILKKQTMSFINSNKELLCEHTIEISEEGIKETTEEEKEFDYWKEIKSVKENKDYIFIFIDTDMFHIIPKRAFKDMSESKKFYNSSIEYLNKSRKNSEE